MTAITSGPLREQARMMDLMVQVRERYEAVIREICHNEDCM